MSRIRIYTPVHINFLRKNVTGRSFEELTRLFNEHFGLTATKPAVKSICRKYEFRNSHGRGIPRPKAKKYSEEQLNHLRQIVPGTPYKIVLEKFNKKFGFSIGLKALRALCKARKIQNGLDGCFPKGHVPANKGKKGYCAPGSEKGWFRPGHPGYKFNEMPIGSERITVDGYTEVKFSDNAGNPSKRWKGKHVMIWEKNNGPVPKGHVVIFADGDRRNFKLNNLQLVSRKELAVLNHLKMLSKDKDLNQVSVNLARLKVIVADSKRGTLKIESKKKLVIIDTKGNKIFIAQDVKTKRYIPARNTRHGVRRLRVAMKSRANIEDAQKDLIAYALKKGWHRE